MKIRHMLILALCVLFGGYCLFSFQAAVTPYVGIAEAKQRTGNVQVKGMLSPDKTPSYRDGTFRFFLTDEAGGEVEVVYRGMKPDGFDDAVHIVAAGTYRDQAIQAKQLLIKCPSKYEGRRLAS